MSRRHPYDEYLRNIPAFAACSDKELSHIISVVDTLDIAAGRTLTREGEPGTEAFILVRGRAEVEVGGAVVATLGPGQHFGELSLLDHNPRDATVRMVEDGRVLVLTPTAFFTLLRDVPGLVDAVLKALVPRVRTADRLAADAEHATAR
jgi:CRP-like cAMP-binding protein